MKTKLIIIDDHEIFSIGVKMILEDNLNADVVKNFVNGKEAFEYMRSNIPVDLIIADLNMPEMDGFKFLENIRKSSPSQKVLIVSMHHSKSVIEKCKDLGAYGFLQKDEPLPVLLNSIAKILKGEKVFDSEPIIESNEWDLFLRGEFKLSQMELKIINLLLEQKNNREISDILNLSYLTIKTHRKNIYRKLGVHNIAGIHVLWKENMNGGFDFK